MTAKSSRPNPAVRLVVVGSIGIDTITTPHARREGILGGSASYACAAASFFTPTGMVGVVGSDFPPRFRRLYRRFGVDLQGLEVRKGKTFRWEGVYEQNMDHRRTVATELNVFAEFSPELPAAYRGSPYLFLGNISPALQLHVLDQMERPRFVMADTMDLWIDIARPDLERMIRRVDLLTLNESEARKLTGEYGLLKAARHILRMGPRYVLIKKGENGSVLFTGDAIWLIPAFPLEDVRDPTGAGDTFAGGLMGYLANLGRVSAAAIRKAMLYGSIAASFGVQAFSLDRLGKISVEDIEERAALFRGMIRP